LPTLHVAGQEGEPQPEPRLQNDSDAGEQQGVEQAAVEDPVTEDRPGVVLDPHELRDLEAAGLVQAQDDSVGQRVQQEPDQDHQEREHEQQVGRALANRPSSCSQCVDHRPGSRAVSRMVDDSRSGIRRGERYSSCIS
jgi:hypothetical protein